MMHYPNQDEVILCPHCKGRTAYTQAKIPQIDWNHPAVGGEAAVMVRYCHSCGKPIIQYWTPAATELYPKQPVRPLAPEELRKKGPEIAADYDEAVNCEPYSKQASIILLSRCASQLLVATKCEGMKKSGYLKEQFAAAIKAGAISGPEVEQVKDLAETRNSIGHVWYDKDGHLLRVDDDDVDWWFEIVDWLIAQLYVDPAKAAARMDRIRSKYGAKKEGDKV